MSWAEIKHSINSNLNTPLNSLIESVQTNIINLINSQRSLGASDSILKVLLSDAISPDDVNTEIGRFTINKSGSVRVAWDMRGKSVGVSSGAIYFSVYTESGDKIFEESTSSNVTEEWTSFTKDISVNANTTYIIYGRTSGLGNGYINNVKICASVIDTSFIS